MLLSIIGIVSVQAVAGSIISIVSVQAVVAVWMYIIWSATLQACSSSRKQ